MFFDFADEKHAGWAHLHIDIPTRMAKRHLGIGKAAKAKKQKTESVEPDATAAPGNEISVELNEDVDANDELAQLKALWKTYFNSERDNELVLNGIVHECDRLLRNSYENGASKEKERLPDYFHSIYALALSELANFHTDDIKKVKEYFSAASERIDLGLEAYPSSADILTNKARLLFNRVPLEMVSQLDVHSKKTDFGDIKDVLDDALTSFDAGIAEIGEKSDFYTAETFDILLTFDDLLDMIDNFGLENMEGEDSDEEDEEVAAVELSSDHPLFSAKQEKEKYNKWWRKHMVQFLEKVSQQITSKGVKANNEEEEVPEEIRLQREICSRLGQALLVEAEGPTEVFTKLAYDENFSSVNKIEGLTQKSAQESAIKTIKEAVKYFKLARDPKDPETWVHIAEALISLGNLYDLESKDQEETYKQAEAILVKANNATNGKYEDILENLLQQ